MSATLLRAEHLNLTLSEQSVLADVSLLTPNAHELAISLGVSEHLSAEALLAASPCPVVTAVAGRSVVTDMDGGGALCVAEAGRRMRVLAENDSLVLDGIAMAGAAVVPLYRPGAGEVQAQFDKARMAQVRARLPALAHREH